MDAQPRGLPSNLSRANIGAVAFASIVQHYLAYYASSSTHTARAKRLDLACFTKFLARHKGLSDAGRLKMRDWDFSSVQRFVDHMLSRGEAPATVARRLATLKHMGRTYAEQIHGFTNPARVVKPPRLQPTRPKSLAPQELRSVRRRAVERFDNKKSFIRNRNMTLFEFLIDTGLRADEERLLKYAQIDEKLEWITNVRTKGRRYRNVYITSAIRPLLGEYLNARELELRRFFAKLTATQSRALPMFISTYRADPENPESFMMGAKTIWRAIQEFSEGKGLHPHLLRHSYALDLLESSNDIRLVSQALGHSDVRITMRYTERRDREIASALEQSRRRKRGKNAA